MTFGAVHLDPEAPSGLNRYSGELLRAMLAAAPEMNVYAAAPAAREEFGNRVRLVAPRRLSRTDTVSNASRLAWNQLVLPHRLRSDRSDVFFSPIPEGSFTPAARQVVTVHDVMPLLFPSAHPRLRYYYRYVVPRVLRASAAVIAVSEATRRDLERFWDLGDLPVHVIYQGYRDAIFAPACGDEIARVRQRYGLDRYLLAVGDSRAHKNIAGLISAFMALRAPGVELAIVGGAGSDEILGPAGVAALGMRPPVRFLGAVPDRDLAPLYSGAQAFVFPSIYEGFGIPPLEAMACGCPAVVSRVASLPEVCGDAALYVDPSRPESVAEGMGRVLADGALRESLRVRGLERARGFRYTETAEKVLRVLRPLGPAPLRRG